MKLNRKNKLLLVGFFLSIFLCYNFAISKTLHYLNQYNSKLKIVENIDTNPKTLALLKYKEKQIDKWLLENGTKSSSNFQNELLKKINTYSELHKLKVIDFQVPHQFLEKESSIISYSFALEGNFNSVLKLLNKFENEQNLGQIKHIATLKKTNYKTNEDYLVTTVIVERVEKKN